MKNTPHYGATIDDLQSLAALAGIEFVEEPIEDGDIDGVVPPIPSDETLAALLHDLVEAALASSGDHFAWFVHQNRRRIFEGIRFDKRILEALILGYQVGISKGSGGCMNDLGALYYMGEVVEQDFTKAADLYEMAVDAGCYQSIINLGYIYEYGRLGQPDHQQAYQWYALAAALAPSSEATYKLGDMYSRGQAVPEDKRKAYQLYERSLSLANGPAEVAQPALRIAAMLIDPACELHGVAPDPLRALALYQKAEIGLRQDIAQGQTYYRKRLAEVIEGQAKARALVDDSTTTPWG